VPGEAFGPSGYLRLSYALGDDDLVEGVSRIQKLLGLAHSFSQGRLSARARTIQATQCRP
jgi:hypothetical protein